MTPTPFSATHPGISLVGVSKSYGSKRVLTDVTADLPAGRIYGLLGANGVGKTTLMALISGHTFRTGGQILVDGVDPVEHAAVLQRMCFIHEDQRYNDVLTVGQILSVTPSFYPDWSAETADRLVEAFRLPRGTRSKKLSRGQRSALAITISLASRAAYTFLDEPYLGLDASARSIFYDELLREYAEHPRTIILSTHLIDEAADLMEEVLILEDGTVAVQTDVDEARRASFLVRGREADVRALVGEREVLTERRLGAILSATVRGQASAEDHAAADRAHLSIEATTLQEFVAAIGTHSLDSHEAGHDRGHDRGHHRTHDSELTS
ncbi:MAG: ABC transporter ATP-binding protein [Dermatophilaceae bacterium]